MTKNNNNNNNKQSCVCSFKLLTMIGFPWNIFTSSRRYLYAWKSGEEKKKETKEMITLQKTELVLIHGSHMLTLLFLEFINSTNQKKVFKNYYCNYFNINTYWDHDCVWSIFVVDVILVKCFNCPENIQPLWFIMPFTEIWSY